MKKIKCTPKVHFAPIIEINSKPKGKDVEELKTSESNSNSESESAENSIISKITAETIDADDNETQITEQLILEKMSEMSLTFQTERVRLEIILVKNQDELQAFKDFLKACQTRRQMKKQERK